MDRTLKVMGEDVPEEGIAKYEQPKPQRLRQVFNPNQHLVPYNAPKRGQVDQRPSLRRPRASLAWGPALIMKILTPDVADDEAFHTVSPVYSRMVLNSQTVGRLSSSLMNSLLYVGKV
jgi:hypothetical protein